MPASRELDPSSSVTAFFGAELRRLRQEALPRWFRPFAEIEREATSIRTPLVWMIIGEAANARTISLPERRIGIRRHPRW